TGTAAVLGFAGGMVLMSLGPPGATARFRAGMGIGAVAVLALLYFARAVALPSYLAARYDYDRLRQEENAAGISRGVRVLAAKERIPLKPEGAETVLIFRRDRLSAWNTPLASVTGMDARPGSVAKLQKYLEGRRFTTSLSDP